MNIYSGFQILSLIFHFHQNNLKRKKNEKRNRVKTSKTSIEILE